MPNAIGTNAKFGYIKETTWGATPAATAVQLLRATGITPSFSKTYTQSQELTTAREIQDYIATDQKGGLTFNHELSAGNLDDVLQSLTAGVWATNVLKIGTTRLSLSHEVQFPDITQNVAFLGSIYNALSVTVKKGAIISGSTGFVSKFPVWNVASIGTGNTPAPTNTVMDPIGSLQLLQDGGSGSVVGCVDFSMNLANTLIEFPTISSADLFDLQMGQFTAKGQLSVYFADRTYIDKFVNSTDSSIAITLGGVASHSYAFLFNKIKYSNVTLQGLSVNNAVVAQMDWMAKTDATNSTMKITRVA